MKKNFSQKELILITFSLSFCSLLYELIFSQLMAVFLGSTVLSYSLGVGVFVLALGAGALFYDFLPLRFKSLKILFFVELALCLAGILGGYVELIFARGFSAFPLVIQYGLFLCPVWVVGFLSGLELPLLLGVRSEFKEKFYILSADFTGMFLAAIAFPFCFFAVGLFKLSVATGFLNLLIAYRLIKGTGFLTARRLVVLALMLVCVLLYAFDEKVAMFRNLMFLGSV